MPFLFVIYLIAALDRSNIGVAGLDMTRELGFSNAVFGFGAGVFYLGYVLLEIPGALIAELWSARKWIARIMVSWELAAVLTGMIHTAGQFCWARFLLGVAEAGFTPGVIVFLGHWYRDRDRGKAIAVFLSGIPLSQVLGTPISSLLLKVHWFGYSGWRWLLILEGLPAVVFGIVTFFYLTDRPEQARWLGEEERAWINGEIEREKQAKQPELKITVWQAFYHRDVMLLCLVWFLGSCASGGLLTFLPKFIQKLSGFSSAQVALMAGVPYLLGWTAMLLAGWSSDRLGERRWHLAGAFLLTGAGFLGSLRHRLSGHVYVFP